METDHGKRWKILSAVFFVGFTHMYILALIRAAYCWNKKNFSLKVVKRNFCHSFYLLRLLCDLYYLLFKGNDVKNICIELGIFLIILVLLYIYLCKHSILQKITLKVYSGVIFLNPLKFLFHMEVSSFYLFIKMSVSYSWY